MTRRLATPGALALAVTLVGSAAACKKTGTEPPSEAMDAGDVASAPRGPVTVRHAPTRLELVVPVPWLPSEPTDVERIAQERIDRLGRVGEEPARDGTIADLRRPADRGQPTLAAPRLVVVARPADRPVDVERALDRESDALRALQSSGVLTLQRTARSRRLVGGLDMGEIRVDYTVPDPRGGPGALVVHRAWLGGRSGPDGSAWEVALVVTYLVADEDLVAREVEDVLKNTHFALPSEAEPNP